jgi:hypothetical protein
MLLLNLKRHEGLGSWATAYIVPGEPKHRALLHSVFFHFYDAISAVRNVLVFNSIIRFVRQSKAQNSIRHPNVYAIDIQTSIYVLSSIPLPATHTRPAQAISLIVRSSKNAA